MPRKKTMHIQTERTSRLADLAVQLAQATARAAEARAELKKAERRSDRADDEVAAISHEYDLERLRLWGDSPDVAVLLAPGGSMCLYYAGEALAKAYGLGWGMQWADTKQTVLYVQLNRGEEGAVQRAATGVRFFAPYVKPKNGMVRFGVRHRESSDFALELRWSRKSGLAKIVRMRHGFEDGVQPFPSLEDALRYIEAEHWIEDIIDLPAGQELLG